LHKRNETIRGHVFCSFLALLLKHDLESRMKLAGVQSEWAEVIRGLDNLHQVEANFPGRSFLFRSQLQAHASAAIREAQTSAPTEVSTAAPRTATGDQRWRMGEAKRGGPGNVQ
jgi:hypothetical protein